MKRILMLASLCALLCNTSCKKEKEKEKVDEYYVTSPIMIDTMITKDYVCQIHAIQHIEIRAQQRGYLVKNYVDEGKFVKKGDPLFQIMPNLYQAEMETAQAEANFREIEYKNTLQLADQNVVSPNELALAKAKFAKATAELSLKKVHLGFTTLKAPFNGLINRFHVRLGSLINEGDLLTSLSDNSKMWVYYNVPEALYLDLKSQFTPENPLKVTLQMANGEIFNQPGYVKRIIADFDNKTGNIPFRATFENPDKLLRHGETGNIIMNVYLNNVMVIPQKATFEVLTKKYVFVLDKANKLMTREVTIDTEMRDLFVISKGLKLGDRILLEGLRKVKEGDTVSPEFQEPKYVISHLVLHAE